MTPARRRRAAPILLLLFAAAASWGRTIALSRPFPAVCETGADAVFAVEKGALRPVSGEFSIAPDGEPRLSANVQIPGSGAPGDLLRLYLWSAEPLDAVRAEAGASGRQPFSTSTGFRVQASGVRELWAVLLAVPSLGASPGTVTLTAIAGRRSFLALRGLAIPARTFASETIELDAGLSGLMTKPDPLKKAEAEAMARLLASPHPDALFELGSLGLPLAGSRRSAGYGDRRSYRYTDKTTSLSVHEGVDIAAPEGSPVAACGRGRVAFAAERVMTGKTVVLEHLPGLFSLYFHLSAIAVREGDVVDRGGLLGAVGMTGLATGPHLHWEVRTMGRAVDPDALRAGPLLDKTADFADTQPLNDEGR
jgi:murein DD-endopeptidase MepM/ murein hydrolase activator NlpD